MVDNHLTPYVLVDATVPEVAVPAQYVKDGKILLNISPAAVRALVIDNEWVAFGARFSGAPCEIRLPVVAVKAIYAQENSKGMLFPDEEEAQDSGEPPALPPQPPSPKPRLKLVK